MTRSLAIGATLCAIACASVVVNSRTAMDSMPAKELQGRVFHNILVVAAFDDIGLLRETEERFATASVRGNIAFVPSYQVFFPGRQYTLEESAGLLGNHSIEGVLVISVRQSGENAYYVPPTYVSGCTAWNPLYGCTQVVTAPVGGGSYAKPWARFSAQLYDAKTGVPLWVATAATGGSAVATSLTLVQSMADETMARLVTDGVIDFCPAERPFNLARSRLRSDHDSLAAAGRARSGSRATVSYSTSAGASPEHVERVKQLNDSIARVQHSADSLVQVLESRIKADSAEVRATGLAAAKSCPPRQK